MPLRLRVRHVHIPSIPPQYTSWADALNFRAKLLDQISASRECQGVPSWLASVDPFTEHNHARLSEWLRFARPPPAVISFTTRPTYLVPESVAADDSKIEKLRQPLRVEFPKPPEWSASNLIPQHLRQKLANGPQDDPLDHSYEPGVVGTPHIEESAYLGPGQLILWPVLDPLDTIQLVNLRDRTDGVYQSLLEATTIAILRRDFGIVGYSRPDAPGVWVGWKNEEQKRIATLQTNLVGADRVAYGIAIHLKSVGRVGLGPWERINQDRDVTSVTDMLANDMIDLYWRPDQISLINHWVARIPRHQERTTAFWPGGREVVSPFCSDLRNHVQEPVTSPLGMIPYATAVAWSHEFARQLGMHDGLVDHMTNPMNWITREVSKWHKRAPRPFIGSWKDNELSWPRSYEFLMKLMEKSVGGNQLDTRVSDQGERAQKVAKESDSHSTNNVVVRNYQNFPKTSSANVLKIRKIEVEGDIVHRVDSKKSFVRRVDSKVASEENESLDHHPDGNTGAVEKYKGWRDNRYTRQRRPGEDDLKERNARINAGLGWGFN